MLAAQGNLADLQEFLGVSKLEIKLVDMPENSSHFIKEIVVAHADGQKCERCWHWEEDVGANAKHPTLCGRCVGAVEAAVR